MKKLIAVSMAAAAALLLAACSSSSSAPSGSGSGSGSTNAGLAAAQAFIQPFLSSPTSIGIDTPLSKKPAPGKLIVGLDGGTASSKVLADAWAQASKDLGWTYKDIAYGPTQENEQKAMESAIALNPDGIVLSGITVATVTSLLADAAAKGIKINASGSTDPASPTQFYDTSIGSTDFPLQSGKMVAAEALITTNGSANVQMFTLPIFPILAQFDVGFKAALMQWCPTCTATELPQQATDIGTAIPAAVVSTLQKNPDTNWLTFDLGDAAGGVDSAVSAAGLGSAINIGGLLATQAGIEAVKDGKETAWTAYPTTIVGYRQIDSLAREFNGDPILKAALPTQLIVKSNASNLVVDSAGNYIGVADYQQQFEKLWLVSS